MLVLVPSSVKRILTQILVIAKLNGSKDFTFRGCIYDLIYSNKESPVQN